MTGMGDPIRCISRVESGSVLLCCFSLTYNYHLTGGIKSITDPFADEITYTPDKVGRTTAVTGTSFGDITSYASAVSYRAFGAVKSSTIETSRATTITQDFDTGLRLTN